MAARTAAGARRGYARRDPLPRAAAGRGHPPLRGRRCAADHHHPRCGPPLGAARMTPTAEAYLAALRAGDKRAAFRLLDDALDRGEELSTLYLEVVQPAMRE